MPKLNIISESKNELRLKLDKSENGFITRDFEIFKKIFNVLNDLLTSIPINLNEEGLNFNCMDSNHISYIKGFFPADFFEEYNFQQNKTYGLDIGILNKIFSITKTSNDMKICFNDDKIEITFDDGNNKKFYDVKLLDIDSESLEIVDSEKYNLISLNSKEFNLLCREINDLGTTIDIEIFQNSNLIKFSVEGDMAKMVSEKYNRYNSSIDCKICADIKYLLTFSKFSSLSNNVTIKIDNEFPLKISYDLPRDSNLYFYLSPKISDY